MGTSDDRAIQFATQIFDLLDRASTTSTYKYAVLLGLLDCCQAQVRHDGSIPQTVTTRQLAEKVVELYWAQTKPYAGTGGVLRQNSGSQAKILTLIDAFREKTEGVPSPYRASLLAPDAYEKLIRKVEWSLVEMPLPKLQRLGGNVHEFLYTIGWDDHVRKRASGFSAYQRGKSSSFDNRIMLKPGVGEFLVRLGPLLRPLVQREWAKTVAGFNGLPLDALESFLFDQQRRDLGQLVRPLEEVQRGRCFYCERELRRGREVDHFIPWSRSPNDELHNFVLAHRTCNNSKSDHLADVVHLRRWRQRNDSESKAGARFREAMRAVQWQMAPAETLSVARAIYFSVPDGMLLWKRGDEFVSADRREIEKVLG